jgi:uncharacterized protein (DUF427 family)
MPRATWKGATLAESDQTILVEGNHYFPPQALHREFLRHSEHHTHCGWKGEASYFDVVVSDQTNANAAWYYPVPLEAARQIAGYVAFWKGVHIET